MCHSVDILFLGNYTDDVGVRETFCGIQRPVCRPGRTIDGLCFLRSTVPTGWPRPGAGGPATEVFTSPSVAPRSVSIGNFWKEKSWGQNEKKPKLISK